MSRTQGPGPARWKTPAFVLLAVWVNLLVLAAMLNVFVAQPAANGDSIVPAYGDGDNTIAIKVGSPGRGDQATFEDREGETRIGIVAGVPGDRAEVVGGSLLVNGQPVPQLEEAGAQVEEEDPVELGDQYLMVRVTAAGTERYLVDGVGDRVIGAVSGDHVSGTAMTILVSILGLLVAISLGCAVWAGWLAHAKGRSWGWGALGFGIWGPGVLIVYKWVSPAGGRP